MQRSQPCSSRFSQKLVKWESFDEILTFFLYFEPYFASLRQNVDHRLFEMWLLLNLFNKLWPAMVFLLQTAARRIILPLKCGPPISLKLRLRHATTVWRKRSKLNNLWFFADGFLQPRGQGRPGGERRLFMRHDRPWLHADERIMREVRRQAGEDLCKRVVD